eukprot:1721038-Pleurochrysis_carterae.AAC.11
MHCDSASLPFKLVKLASQVAWDEEHELTLLTQMGWSHCMGSSACAHAVAPAALRRKLGRCACGRLLRDQVRLGEVP